MNRFAFANQHQNNNNALLIGGEMMNGVVCPKPRRLRLLSPPVKESIISASSSRCQHNYLFHQTETCELKARTELLDMILTKECCYDGDNVVLSSPPFLCGSPPSRASNPVVQDAEFSAFEASGSPSGCRGENHPAVRVEGFNCRGISAVA